MEVKHHCVVASCASSTGDLAHSPGMCPDWESNWQPLGSQHELNPLKHSSQGCLKKKKRFYLFLFRERGRKRRKYQCVVASHTPPTGHLAHNPGMCPAWESNQCPFGSQASTQFTEPHQPGLKLPLNSPSIRQGISKQKVRYQL